MTVGMRTTSSRTRTGVSRGEFRRNQPGGTLGGPLPWSRKHAFFFISYQATRDVNSASLASSRAFTDLAPQFLWSVRPQPLERSSVVKQDCLVVFRSLTTVQTSIRSPSIC